MATFNSLAIAVALFLASATAWRNASCFNEATFLRLKVIALTWFAPAFKEVSIIVPISDKLVVVIVMVLLTA